MARCEQKSCHNPVIPHNRQLRCEVGIAGHEVVLNVVSSLHFASRSRLTVAAVIYLNRALPISNTNISLQEIFDEVDMNNDRRISCMHELPVAVTVLGLPWTKELGSTFLEGGIKGLRRGVQRLAKQYWESSSASFASPPPSVTTSPQAQVWSARSDRVHRHAWGGSLTARAAASTTRARMSSSGSSHDSSIPSDSRATHTLPSAPTPSPGTGAAALAALAPTEGGALLDVQAAARTPHKMSPIASPQHRARVRLSRSAVTTADSSPIQPATSLVPGPATPVARTNSGRGVAWGIAVVNEGNETASTAPANPPPTATVPASHSVVPPVTSASSTSEAPMAAAHAPHSPLRTQLPGPGAEAARLEALSLADSSFSPPPESVTPGGSTAKRRLSVNTTFSQAEQAAIQGAGIAYTADAATRPTAKAARPEAESTASAEAYNFELVATPHGSPSVAALGETPTVAEAVAAEDPPAPEVLQDKLLDFVTFCDIVQELKPILPTTWWAPALGPGYSPVREVSSETRRPGRIRQSFSSRAVARGPAPGLASHITRSSISTRQLQALAGTFPSHCLAAFMPQHAYDCPVTFFLCFGLPCTGRDRISHSFDVADGSACATRSAEIASRLFEPRSMGPVAVASPSGSVEEGGAVSTPYMSSTSVSPEPRADSEHSGSPATMVHARATSAASDSENETPVDEVEVRRGTGIENKIGRAGVLGEGRDKPWTHAYCAVRIMLVLTGVLGRSL